MSTGNKHLLTAAKTYLSKNICVVATDSAKIALFPWKHYQGVMITEDEIASQLSHVKAQGLAVICGKVSGSLEVIDIDLKNDLTGELYQHIIDNIPDELLGRLRIIRTRSGGYHLYYRCKTIGGNQKLAMRPPTEDELKESPHVKQVVLIETRGEAGYVIAPPTDGYQVEQKKEIPDITPDERDTLLHICRSFSEIIEEERIIPKGKDKAGYGITPWDDYNERGVNDMLELLQSHGWTRVRDQGERIFFKRPGKSDTKTSGDYHTGKNVFKVFTSSSEFNPGKGYSPFGVYCLLEHKGDPSAAAKALLKLGYGEKSHKIDSKHARAIRRIREQGYDDQAVKDKLKGEFGVPAEEADSIIKEYDKLSGRVISTFWDVDEKGKISISRYKFDKFLREEGGFHIFFYDPASNIYRIVQEKDGFIEEVSIERIKKFIKKYIQSLEPLEPFDFGTTSASLLEVILKGSDSYFSKGLLEFLDEKKFDFFKDERDRAYFPFSNSVVSIDKDSVAVKSYKEVKKVIWKSQVIPFEITVLEDFDPKLSEFYKFLELISGGEPDRVWHCMSLIGYLLHKYKDFSRPWSIILAEETEDEQKGGGTGKGIFVKAISYLSKTIRIDGKNFKSDKNFAFQRVGLDTRIMAIEDVRKNLDFEAFYSIITEGTTVEKKNKDELFISYVDAPKILFTTNYTITSSGAHARRRQRVFEFAPYFNDKHTPHDEFGHLLFEDWDTDEWNRFYNLMFTCVKQYLREGVKDVVNSEKLKRKHIRLNYTPEFLEYIDGVLSNGAANWHAIGEEYLRFLDSNEIDKKEYSMKRFKKALDESSKLLGFELHSRRNKQNANKFEFRLSGNGIAPTEAAESKQSSVEFDF